MAHRVFMSGPTFFPGDDCHHEHIAVCDTSEYLIFVALACAGSKAWSAGSRSEYNGGSV